MCAVVAPDRLDAFMAVCRKWDVEAVVIGEVNDSGRLTIEWHGDQIVDVPPKTVAHEGPVYQRPYARPAWQDELQADAPTSLPRPMSGDELRQTLLQLVGSPNLASKSWVTDQYDRYVLGNTVLAQPEDSGIVRIAEDGLGVAVSTDGNGRYGKLDPYAGAQLALAEAYRNVATTGAKPLAVTNCLNFGSPEDTDVMWQFAETTRGLADACQQLGVPVTGGNVSFYNQTGDTAILPTPIIGVLGVIDDVARRTPMAWSSDGDAIWLVGETADELAGSEWAHLQGHLGGLPPKVDLERERQVAEIAVAASRDGLLTAAHDVSVGGLGVTLAEMAMRSGKGARVFLPDDLDPFLALFSESQGRIVFVVPRSEEVRFTDMCTARGVPAARIGVVDGQAGGLEVQGQFTIPLDELRAASEHTFPALFD
jgi:phosphoribosylformylglycinamidine synthase